jgi:hypothetical protein
MYHQSPLPWTHEVDCDQDPDGHQTGYYTILDANGDEVCEPHNQQDGDLIVSAVNCHAELLAACEAVAKLKDLTLLGPDSKHNMGDDAPCYHELGANAAFNQAAALVEDAIAKAKGVKP